MLVSPHHFRHGGGEIRGGWGKSYKPPTPCREEKKTIYLVRTSMFLSLQLQGGLSPLCDPSFVRERSKAMGEEKKKNLRVYGSAKSWKKKDQATQEESPFFFWKPERCGTLDLDTTGEHLLTPSLQNPPLSFFSSSVCLFLPIFTSQAEANVRSPSFHSIVETSMTNALSEYRNIPMYFSTFPLFPTYRTIAFGKQHLSSPKENNINFLAGLLV